MRIRSIEGIRRSTLFVCVSCLAFIPAGVAHAVDSSPGFSLMINAAPIFDVDEGANGEW